MLSRLVVSKTGVFTGKGLLDKLVPMSFHSFHSIGVAKENESPENPGGFEKRVALIPDDVSKLVQEGCDVSVESGAGERIGFGDQEYLSAGARIVSREEVYTNKDLLIKFKGPSLESIPLMSPGTTLFCMAHFDSYPARAKLFKHHQINVIAMEEIRECPKVIPDEIVLSKTSVQTKLNEETELEPAETDVLVLGYSDRLVGGIRRIGNRNPRSLTLIQADRNDQLLEGFTKQTVAFYDTKNALSPSLQRELESFQGYRLDLSVFEEERSQKKIEEYRESHPPYHFGLRRIQCLHETGRAGARYGLRLLEEESHRSIHPHQAKVAVLGYGNVGMGAIHECYQQGVPEIRILGRTHTVEDGMSEHLRWADLIINGAEQPRKLRGKNFLVRRHQVEEFLRDGSVVIDLIGGSASNRSPVEHIVECTFLTKPYFLEDGIYFSSLWGWPMMGFERETAIKYSSQIVDILLGPEKLIRGLDHLMPGVEVALVNDARNS